jgi:hypothetical protein
MSDAKKVGLPPMLVRRIKTLQRLSGISEENYRDLLWGYEVESCTELTITAGHAVAEFLQHLVDRIPEHQQFRQPYRDLKGRSALMATVRQLRMLEAMWMDVTRQTNRRDALSAYHTFLYKRFDVGSPEWIERDHVGKIKFALEQMRAQRER